MKFIKPLLAPTLTLLIIGIVVATALSVTNYITKDRITAKEQEKIAQAMEQLIPHAQFTLTNQDSEQDIALYTATTDGFVVGTVVRSSAMGYKSEIQVLTAFGPSGEITGVSVTNCANESPGIGQKVGTDASFLEQFQGNSHPVDTIDAITGATYSCDGVKDAVNLAITYQKELSTQVYSGFSGGVVQ